MRKYKNGCPWQTARERTPELCSPERYIVRDYHQGAETPEALHQLQR